MAYLTFKVTKARILLRAPNVFHKTYLASGIRFCSSMSCQAKAFEFEMRVEDRCRPDACVNSSAIFRILLLTARVPVRFTTNTFHYHFLTRTRLLFDHETSLQSGILFLRPSINHGTVIKWCNSWPPSDSPNRGSMSHGDPLSRTIPNSYGLWFDAYVPQTKIVCFDLVVFTSHILPKQSNK